MDLRYINTFHTIVEAGGFNKAAEKLCYTQSTITFHVSQLEKELGVQLFEKAGRHMVLTKAGQELVPYVENVLQSVNNMKSFRSVIEECQGDIRIAAPESLLCFHLPKILREFRKQAPRVHIYLDSMTSTSVYRAIRENKTDIGIFYDLHVDDATIKVVPYKDFDFVMFASPKIKSCTAILLRLIRISARWHVFASRQQAGCVKDSMNILKAKILLWVRQLKFAVRRR